MNNLIEMSIPLAAGNSRAVRLGRKLIALAFALRALNGLAVVLLLLVFGAAPILAQTPSGSFFNGNSAQLGNSLRSVTFFLAAAM
ncbi:MAG: hypothetical protein DMF69_25270, partial [Acidobacteria bacterium]